MFNKHYGSLGFNEMILDIREASTIYITSRRFKSWKGTHYIFNDSVFGGKPLLLGTLLTDFLSYNFNSYNEFADFVDKYGISGLGSLAKSLKNIKLDTSFNDEAKEKLLSTAWNESKEILNKAQRYFKRAVYYCLDLESGENLNILNSKQRFYLLNFFPDIKEELNSIIPEDEMTRYIDELKTVFFTDSADIGKIKLKDITEAPPRDIKDAVELIKDFDFVAKKSYHSPNIISLLYIEFVELINNNTPVKKCGHCGHYFIPEHKIDTEFCNRIVKYINGVGRTCKEVGPKERYRSKKMKEPLNLLFDRKYKTLYARMNSKGKKSITVKQFDYWRDMAREKLEIAISGTDSEKEKFKKWLEESSKIEWFKNIESEVNENGKH